jgi:hypothetical protein
VPLRICGLSAVGSCLKQNHTSICSLGFRRAVAED